MADIIIDGIRCRSYIENLNTGEVKPFEPKDRMRVMKSIAAHMTPAELEALPKAPEGMKPDFTATIAPEGCVKVRDSA